MATITLENVLGSSQESDGTRTWSNPPLTFNGRRVVRVEYDNYRDRKMIMTDDGRIYTLNSYGGLETMEETYRAVDPAAFQAKKLQAAAPPAPKAPPSIEDQIDDAIRVMRAKA